MKKQKILVITVVAILLTLLMTISALAYGNDPDLTTPPAVPDFGFNDGYWNTGKTKLSSPFSYNGDQDVTVKTTNYPYPGKGQTVYHYIFVGDAPTKVCFPAELGATTNVFYHHQIRDEWVKLRTFKEIHHSVKYRCAEAPAVGFYGLIGK